MSRWQPDKHRCSRRCIRRPEPLPALAIVPALVLNFASQSLQRFAERLPSLPHPPDAGARIALPLRRACSIAERRRVLRART